MAYNTFMNGAYPYQQSNQNEDIDKEKQTTINTDDFISKEYFDSFTKKLYSKIGELETKITIKEMKGEE